jgi:uncharacterized phage-associated protein
MMEDGGPSSDLLDMVFITVEPKIADDSDAEALLERVWAVYGSMSGVQLSNMTHMTHSNKGAWHNTYYELARSHRGVDIPDDLIKAEFEEKKGAAARHPSA